MSITGARNNGNAVGLKQKRVMQRPAFYKTLKLQQIFLCLALGVLITSCSGIGSVYEQVVDLPGHTWPEKTQLTFNIPVEDTKKKVDILYHIRYDLDYPYYNLYVKFSLEDSLGQVLYADRHELTLMEPESGRPLGSGIGGVYSKDFTALKAVRFAKTGQYKLKIRQYMRQEVLAGVYAFGVRVKDAE
jgi:gliding motility-associated lipoprotein GldH